MSNVTGQWMSVKKHGFPEPEMKDISPTGAYAIGTTPCAFMSKHSGGVYFGYLKYSYDVVTGQFTPSLWHSNRSSGGIDCEVDDVIAWLAFPERPKLKYINGPDDFTDGHFILIDDLTDENAEVKESP